MARIRSIKPELRTSITVSAWPREVRYFFILLWGYLDDYGRGVDDELLIASDCFPRDRDVTPERVDGWLEMIADSGPLCRYEVDGRSYLHAPNWREHQKPSHPTRSKIPPCPDDEPEDFKVWREAHPQRLRNRSRKSREGLQKIPEPSPGAPERLSGGGSGASSSPPVADTQVVVGSDAAPGPGEGETAGHATSGETPESLAKASGDIRGIFAPEQGSKGAREQGVKPLAREADTSPPAVDTQAGALPVADRMADAFMDRFRRGNSYRRHQVRQTFTTALGNDTNPDELWRALERLGDTSKPVSAGTLQFALSDIRKTTNVRTLPTTPRPAKSIDDMTEEEIADALKFGRAQPAADVAG